MLHNFQPRIEKMLLIASANQERSKLVYQRRYVCWPANNKISAVMEHQQNTQK